MVMRGCVGAAVLIVALAACAATPVAQGPEAGPGAEPGTASSGPAVSWQGHQLREVTSLAALPASIRRALGADNPGLNGMAEKGQRFNVGDALIGDLPRRRFITAGHDGDTWLVAFEQGGIALFVTAVEISGGVGQKGWFVDCCPTTLAEVVRQISAKPPDIVPPKP